MSTITETITSVKIDDLTKNQFLAQDFEVTQKLNEDAKKNPFKPQYVWRNVLLFLALHVGALVGFYQLFFVAKWQTVLWSKLFFLSQVTVMIINQF